MEIFSYLLPEVLLIAAALVLFMFGIVKGPAGRTLAPWVALAGLGVAFVVSFFQLGGAEQAVADWTGAIVKSDFAAYVNLLVTGIGMLLLLLCWPTNESATGNTALRFGPDAGEFYGLILLSLAGIMLCGSANDTMLLFMGIELASIPTYVLVSMSRPLPAAQEAGLKYFYLGAMSAAVMLMGFAWLYGITGSTNLREITLAFGADVTSMTAGLEGSGIESPTFLAGGTWGVLAIVLLILGFSFKLAAFPLHTYAGDVYTGAATPITALLSFVPKTVGIVAMVKILAALAATPMGIPPTVWKLLMAIAILTMTIGNCMALFTENLKRVMAYSSIAHSGYMLVALTILAASGTIGGGVTEADPNSFGPVATSAILGVMFYLAAYGVMNIGIFGVLMLMPTKQTTVDAQGNVRRLPATSAETYSDIQGAGRRRPLLTAAMVICAISLIGIPLTVGFLGKAYVLRPALELAGKVEGADAETLYWLIGITLVNAAIAAGYYLRIIAVMTLQPVPGEEEDAPADRAFERDPAQPKSSNPWPIATATFVSVVGVLFFGMTPIGISLLDGQAARAARSAAQVAVVGPRVQGDEVEPSESEPRPEQNFEAEGIEQAASDAATIN